ncbi:hypothetical protein GJ496_002148 [Pomphorhynchus laevis]|nr:hypothetical protein GJ496_002148 [Pomphorhynchus laevis]
MLDRILINLIKLRKKKLLITALVLTILLIGCFNLFNLNKYHEQTNNKDLRYLANKKLKIVNEQAQYFEQTLNKNINIFKVKESMNKHRIRSISNIKGDRERAQFIKNMTRHAWDTYEKHTMGSNEFRPISITEINPDMFGHGHSLGAFVIDSLDTLMLMRLDNEARAALNWIRDNFKPELVTGFVNVFEVNIRILGGLLGAYSLSNSENDRNVLIRASVAIADLLLKAYDTEQSNLPYSLVNLQTGEKRFHEWSSGCLILSEAGTLLLEMDYLSQITGNRTYSDIARSSTITLIKRFNGNTYISIDNSDTCSKHVSIGALGDSFYEYLLKIEIFSKTPIIKDSEPYTAFLSCLKKIESVILKDSNPNTTYFQEYSSSQHIEIMTHLACFTGGMYALSATARISEDPEVLARFERLARNITWTCRRSYLLGDGLGPENFYVHDNGELAAASYSYYILRPEYAESLFYLYRLTKDNIYKDWAWHMVLQLEKRCKVRGGYASLQNVFNESKNDDIQNTFFIAETLKYLYLIFEEKISLNEYVFNTEGHPFKIKHSTKT